MKTGNGNEKAGITTFEFSAGRRQYCLIAIEYCVLTVLKAKFLQLAPKWGRGHVAKCTNQQYFGVFGLKISIFAPPGLQKQILVGAVKKRGKYRVVGRGGGRHMEY